MEIQPAKLTLLKQYLRTSKHSLPATKFHEQILNNFDANIKQGAIIIPEQQKPFPVLIKSEQNQQETTQKKLQEIIDKKQAIKKQLDLIQSEEEKIMGIKMTQSRTASQKYFKSKMTTEDKEKLKALYQAKKKFQTQLQNKTSMYEEKLKKMEDQNKKQMEQLRRKQHLKKKEQVERSIQLMEKRRQQKKTLQAEENRKLKSLLQQKKLYEEMQRKWKQVQEQELKKKQELKQQLRKIKRIDFEQIKEHEKKHDEAMRVYKESRVKNTSSFDLEQSRSHYQSKFIDSIKEEEMRVREIEEEKKNKVRELSEKKKQYGEQVRTVHKPKKFMKKQDKQNQSKVFDVQNRSLSLFETHQKGNNYMRQVNTKLAQNLKQHPQNRIKKQQPKAFKYTNYLAEIKSNNTSISQRRGKLHQITKLMKNDHIPQDDKLFKAKLLAQKIQNNRGDRQSDSNLLTSINAKLAILKQLD